MGLLRELKQLWGAKGMVRGKQDTYGASKIKGRALGRRGRQKVGVI
jgi:hypothetical protein